MINLEDGFFDANFFMNNLANILLTQSHKNGKSPLKMLQTKTSKTLIYRTFCAQC